MRYLILTLFLVGCGTDNNGVFKLSKRTASQQNIKKAEMICSEKGGLSHVSCGYTGYGINTRHCDVICKHSRLSFEQEDYE